MILDARGNPLPERAWGAYTGSQNTRQRFKGAFSRSLPQDEDHVASPYELDILRRQCLDLRRNNAIVAGVVERFADHVVGPQGITPQAKTSDRAWNEQAEGFWRRWSQVCDVRGRLTMRNLQRMAVQSRLLLGDMGTVELASGHVQPVEAMRIATPRDRNNEANLINGVRLTRTGRPIEYFVHARDKNGYIAGDDYETVAAADFIFLTNYMRADQVRGIPELAPVIDFITDIGRLNAEVLNKAVLDALHAWAVYSEAGAGQIGNLGARGQVLGAAAAGEESKGQPVIETVEGGMTYYMKPGEKLESLASSTPNPQYVAYIELLLRIVAGAICLPYEFLLLDFKQGSFSASRAALMTTYRTFSMWQNWLIEGMLQRLWNWRIAKAIGEGDLPPAPVDAFGLSEWHQVSWATPRYDWLDPKAEAYSQSRQYLLGTTTLTQLTHEQGRDVEDVIHEKLLEKAIAEKLAREINAEYGTDLTWHDAIEVSPAATGGSTEKEE